MFASNITPILTLVSLLLSINNMLLGFRTAAAVLATLWAAASVAGTPSADGHRKRDLRALSDTQVEAIAKLDPPEWETVTGGHLGQLLIPRVCEYGWQSGAE